MRYDASLVRGDARLGEIADVLFEPAKRAFLVVAHEPAITGDVSCQDRCELAFNVLVFHPMASGMLLEPRSQSGLISHGPPNA